MEVVIVQCRLPEGRTSNTLWSGWEEVRDDLTHSLLGPCNVQFIDGGTVAANNVLSWAKDARQPPGVMSRGWDEQKGEIDGFYDSPIVIGLILLRPTSLFKLQIYVTWIWIPQLPCWGVDIPDTPNVDCILKTRHTCRNLILNLMELVLIMWQLFTADWGGGDCKCKYRTKLSWILTGKLIFVVTALSVRHGSLANEYNIVRWWSFCLFPTGRIPIKARCIRLSPASYSGNSQQITAQNNPIK